MRLERRSLDGSVLGRTLGRLGGCIINSLSTELTDRTSTGEAAPKYDYRVYAYDILIRYFANLKKFNSAIKSMHDLIYLLHEVDTLLEPISTAVRGAGAS